MTEKCPTCNRAFPKPRSKKPAADRVRRWAISKLERNGGSLERSILVRTAAARDREVLAQVLVELEWWGSITVDEGLVKLVTS